MPFPLAHTAVVLPLRKFKWLSLSAMMLGCLTPDVGYGLNFEGSSRFAHSAMGSVLFCLPVGLAAYWIFRMIREPLATRLPAPHREVLLPLCRGRVHSWSSIAVSVWIGACSHILLDGLTHESQMLVPHLIGLRSEIAAFERERFYFSRVLWVALSGLGMGVLAFSYAWLIRKRTGRWAWFDRRETGRYAAWFALILLPFFVVAFGTENPVRHWPWRYQVEHFVYDTMALYLVVISVLMILFGFALRLRRVFAFRNPARE